MSVTEIRLVAMGLGVIILGLGIIFNIGPANGSVLVVIGAVLVIGALAGIKTKSKKDVSE